MSAMWAKIFARVDLALAGYSFAGAAVLLAAYELVGVISDPSILYSLGWAIIDLHAHKFTDADGWVCAQVAGAIIAVIGTLLIAVIVARYAPPPKNAIPVDDGGASTKGPSIPCS